MVSPVAGFREWPGLDGGGVPVSHRRIPVSALTTPPGRGLPPDHPSPAAPPVGATFHFPTGQHNTTESTFGGGGGFLPSSFSGRALADIFIFFLRNNTKYARLRRQSPVLLLAYVPNTFYPLRDLNKRIYLQYK